MAANLLCCCYCAAILVYCNVRNLARFCYVIGFEIIRIHPSTRYRIRCGFIFFTLESGLKNIQIRCRIRQMLVGESRIRKEKSCEFKIFRICLAGASLAAYIIIQVMIHQIFPLVYGWSKHVTRPNIPQLKLGNIRDYFFLKHLSGPDA